MVKRRDNPRLRRALILALFLLMPSLLYDLSVLSRTGHKHPGGAPAAGAPSVGMTAQALLPLEPGALHPGSGYRHWHAAAADGDELDGGDGMRDALLRDLVYTHTHGSGGDNNPLRDGGDGFGDGDGKGGGGGGFGGPSGFGSPGHDPGTDFLPFDAPSGPGDKDGPGDNKGPSDPPFLSPTIPSIAAVPEPATWALFILGFGLIGAQLRRARDARPATSCSGWH